MSGFFKKYQKAIIWVVVIAFFVGGVALVSLNQAGVFNQSAGTGTGTSTTNVATVNGEAIPYESAANAAESILSQYLNYYQSVGQSTTELLAGAKGALFKLDVHVQGLNRMIQHVLFGQAADERNISIPRSEVTEAFSVQYNELLETNSLTEADLEQILLQQQRSLAEFKDAMRFEVEIQLRDEALRDQIAGVIAPTDAQLAEYMEANISQFDTAERVRASHILVATESLANDLYAQLQAGADFAQLAAEHSTDAGTKDSGGDLSWFERGMMVTAFEEAAFGLEIGEISEPVPTQYGYHIIKLVDHEDASVPDLEDIKDSVRNAYIGDEETSRFSDWYVEYHAAADIEILDPLLNAYLLQAEDLDLAIAEYERLLTENLVTDQYFEYYVGRAYESRIGELGGEILTLEGAEEPTVEDLARIEELKALKSEYEGKALEHYLNALNEDSVEADDAFVNRVLALDPNSTEARYILGELYADRGDIQNAEIQFEQIISESPTYVRAYIASGDLGVRVGETEKAILRFENALALNPDATLRVALLLRLAKASMVVGELDDAGSYIEQVEELDPEHREIGIVQGDLAAAMLVLAADERAVLSAIEGRTSEQEIQLAEVQSRVSNLAESAIERYQSAIQLLGGTQAELQLKLGQVFLLAGRLNEAEDAFQAVLSVSPYRVDAFEGLAEVQIAEGDIEGALENLYSGLARSFDDNEKVRIAARILEFAADDVATRLQYARLLAQQFNWPDSIREYSAVLSAEPTQVDAYLGISDAYRARQENATALEYLRRGLDYATFDSQKEDLYEAMIETLQTLAGVGEPLPAEGMDARIDLAKLYLTQTRDVKALEQLELVQANDASYRLTEVNALIVEAGGTVETPATETDTDAATSDDADDNAPGEESAETGPAPAVVEEATPESVESDEVTPDDS